MFLNKLTVSFNALEQFDVIRFINVCPGFAINNVAIVIALSLIILASIFYWNLDFCVNSLKKLINFDTSLFTRVFLAESLRMYRYIHMRFLFFVFFYILFSNFLGLIPYSMTITSFLVITLYVSITCFVGANLAGIQLHGFKYFTLFVPEGTPFILIPFLIVIEFISYFARVVSLATRLFANMMAGHTLLKILCNFLWKFTKFFFGPLIFQGIIFWLLIVIIFILETLIAFLQAAVYVMLVNIYMNDLINMH